MVFGANDDQGIYLDCLEPQAVTLGDEISEEDLLVHDSRAQTTTLAYALCHIKNPVAMGVIRQVQRPTYEESLFEQVQDARAKKGSPDLASLYHESDVWEVK